MVTGASGFPLIGSSSRRFMDGLETAVVEPELEAMIKMTTATIKAMTVIAIAFCG